MVEPTWQIAPSTQQLPVSAFGIGSLGQPVRLPLHRAVVDISAGVSDCWSLGQCYAVFMLPQYAQNRPVHADIQFAETDLTTGQPTPGSPVTIHVGKSFSDVPDHPLVVCRHRVRAPRRRRHRLRRLAVLPRHGGHPR